MNRIKKGDDVIVIAGKDKGKQGSVLRVMQDGHLLVSDINMAKRHTNPNPNQGVPGGIVEKEAPIHVSNVAMFNVATGKADRISFKALEDGHKVRVFKSTGEAVDI